MLEAGLAQVQRRIGEDAVRRHEDGRRGGGRRRRPQVDAQVAEQRRRRRRRGRRFAAAAARRLGGQQLSVVLAIVNRWNQCVKKKGKILVWDHLSNHATTFQLKIVSCSNI